MTRSSNISRPLHDESDSGIHPRESPRVRLFDIEEAFRAGPLGFILLDTDNRIVSANLALCSLLGAREAELRGSRIADLIVSADRPAYVSLIHYLNDIEQTHGQLECRLTRSNGTLVWVRITAFAIPTETEALHQFVVIVEEISEGKHTEEKLDASDERWRTLWKNVPDHIIELDRSCMVLSWNHVGEGPDGDKVVGGNFLDYVQPDRREEVKSILQAAWKSGEISVYETGSISSGGSKYWSNRVIPILRQGKVIRLIHIGTDITAAKHVEAERAKSRRELEEQVETRTRELRTALQEKEILLREIHHRVKNNLQIISSLLRLQSRRIDDEATVSVFLESQRRVESMGMIHEYLYRSNHVQLIDFSTYLRDLGHHLLRVYERGQTNVRMDLSVGNIDLSVDEAVPCGLIFSEAVSNALKYAFPDGRDGIIEVSLQRDDDDRLTLLIKDNGVGFSPTLDPLTVDSLGLKLVRQLTEQLGGDLEIFNRDGAALRITIPVDEVANGGSK